MGLSMFLLLGALILIAPTEGPWKRSSVTQIHRIRLDATQKHHPRACDDSRSCASLSLALSRALAARWLLVCTLELSLVLFLTFTAACFGAL